MKPSSVLVLFMMLFVVACRKVSPTQESPKLMLAPGSLTLAVGAADTLTAVLTGVGNFQDHTLDWSSADTMVVRISKVLSPNQAVVFAQNAGSTRVLVAWRADPHVGAVADVTVH